MNEAAWLRLSRPAQMLSHVAGKVSDRKLRLYLCGVCRSFWHLLYDPSSREAVEVAERYADSEATSDELSIARYGAECPTFGHDFNGTWRQFHIPSYLGELPESVLRLVELGVLSADGPDALNVVTDEVARRRVSAAASVAYRCSRENVRPNRYDLISLTAMGRLDRQLLLCVVGNPFRPVAADPSWLTSPVLALARRMYESRDFAPMPILADALQDAGCDQPDVLAHCRGPGPHVRGCWVVDLLLGKA